MITTLTGHPTMQRSAYYAFGLPLLVLATVATAQSEDRAERWRDNCEHDWNNARANFCELRTYTIASSARISVDGGANGGVSFIGENRRDVKIVARIQASADDDAAASAIAKQIRIITDGGEIRSEGPSQHGRTSWSVSYDVYVPSATNLEATTENGGISAKEIQGQMNFEATNGGIHLSDVGGNVHARTTNGGVTADLSGTTWQGQGLDLQTTNGGATVYVPHGYNAQLETGTTNGGMRVDFPITVRGSLNRGITTQLGSGGPLVRVMTTNGGVHIAER
jgi:Putative adhesin